MLEFQTKGREEMKVTQQDTAIAVKSGDLPVFATPVMIALMEQTACGSVRPFLEEGTGTVGVLMNVRHVSATPVGMKVVCESTLIKIDGRILEFEVKAFDEEGLIGEGIHQRAIVRNASFLAKVQAKQRK